MTTVAGQCLQCGHKNTEGISRCVRCDAPLTAHSHPLDRPAETGALPWIIVGIVAFVLGTALLMRQAPATPGVTGSPQPFAASAGEPPSEDLVVVSAPPISGQAPGAPPPAAAVQGQWHSVADLDGVGGKRTPTFSIVARHWRVRWASSASQGASGWIYGIIYYQNGKSAGMAMNGKGESSGVTRLQGRGNYYVEVKSTQSWTMKVEQWY